MLLSIYRDHDRTEQHKEIRKSEVLYKAGMDDTILTGRENDTIFFFDWCVLSCKILNFTTHYFKINKVHFFKLIIYKSDLH